VTVGLPQVFATSVVAYLRISGRSKPTRRRWDSDRQPTAAAAGTTQVSEQLHNHAIYQKSKEEGDRQQLVKGICERECGKWGVGVSVVKKGFRNPLAWYTTVMGWYINLSTW